MISPKVKIRIGEILVEEGILSQDRLDRALAQQKRTGRILGEMLVEQGLVTSDQLLDALSKRLGLRYCTLRLGLADPALIEMIGKEEAIRLKSLPMFKVHETLTVAMAEPQSLPMVDRLRQLTGCTIRPVLAMEGNITEFIRKYTGTATDMDGFLASLSDADLAASVGGDLGEGDTLDLDTAGGDNPVVGLVNMTLRKAIGEHVSDIHIEPDKKATRIRCRLNGVLQDLVSPPTGMHPAIIARVKVIGRMDIAEKRLPQEGRVQIMAEGREIDLRISSMPTLLGEKVVIRILDRANLSVQLEDLGFRDATLSTFHSILRQPYGLVLVTGPTGSGKTTTLYSSLAVIRNPELNIVTVEDPVEYQLDLVNQIQVQEQIGMTFARALRSILRQDPDVIMVGEVRDKETARVAVQAALTGHLVLATLHTNSAPGSVARLVDMGVESYLLSGALNGVVAQRLLRTVCPDCSEQYTPTDNVLAAAGLEDHSGRKFTRGAGCERCRGSGFAGRVGIYEVMQITSDLRRMVHEGRSSQDLSEKWQEGGGLTLRQEGMLLALAGQTSVEEVLRSTHSEGESLPVPSGAAGAEDTAAASAE